MKILHLIYDHTANPWVGGGGAVRAYEIYRRLAREHDITVVCGKYPGAKDYSEGNLKFHFEGTGRDNYILSTFSYAYKAAGFVRKNSGNADVIIEDFAPYNPVFSVFNRKDTVIQLHQREGLHLFGKYLIFGAPFFLVEKFYPKFFRNAIVVSEKGRDKFSLGPGAAVIPNGFDGSYLAVEEGEGDYILFLGRLEIDSKGIDILLDAADSLERGVLKIAGRGKDEEKVKEMLSRLGREEMAQMVGFVDGEKKIQCIRDCAFMVVPSRFEAQGIVVLEAAALGKPVIVSDIPELGYAVEAGFGLAFRRGNAGDLADKIKYLLEDREMRQRMGRKAREFARDYTWDRIAGKYEEYLLNIVERRREGRN